MYENFDYEVTAYPFSFLNMNITGKKITKKYNWFCETTNVIKTDEIEEVIFEGYKNNDYYDMIEKLNGNRKY